MLSFVRYWEARTGQRPVELVFDSRFTTYANLARLHALDIYFLTLRRRAPSILARLDRVPDTEWKRIRLSHISRQYRRPLVYDQVITLRTYPEPLRQLAIKELGHNQPTLLITNRMQEPAQDLIDRYARRMLVENAIEDSINFFHMDALSSTVPLRIQFDLQLTLMASALYRKLAQRVGAPFATAKARSPFERFVNLPATVITTDSQVTVRFGRRSHNQLLRAADYIGSQGAIPWMQNRELVIEYV